MDTKQLKFIPYLSASGCLSDLYCVFLKYLRIEHMLHGTPQFFQYYHA